MTRKWTVLKFRSSRNASRRQAQRRAFRPVVEHLETRVTPANVDVNMFHYNLQITGQNPRKRS